MRWLTLYARSRQVPASLAALMISAAAMRTLTGGSGQEPGDPRLPVLVLATGVMAASVGLSGQDLALDRTAAIRWVPRRAAHVLLAGAVVAAVLLAVQMTGTPAGSTQFMAGTEFVVRNSAGLTGLAALGAALSGGQYAWTLPFAWLSFTFFAPAATSTAMRVATWMLLPAGTVEGTWTALLLLGVGTAAYAFAGPRR
ncbi:hypothetical protein OG226_26310 [Streptomyces sp. NBC_01261]|uniref:hypothetical protein n=1 Tax=Streptomyces sp. NBC_01261 TaxID=2903802 RepID=UPI002E37726C|nr:hypothetical protein [Streptomyces sp. NBC_01261]